MEYRVKDAIQYAKKWWNSHNTKYHYFNGSSATNSDCANFVSQCLYEAGVPEDKVGGKYGKWYINSESWNGANSLMVYLRENTTGIRLSARKSRNINEVKQGDLIFRRYPFKGNTKDLRANHVAIVDTIKNGKIYVYAHNANRGGINSGNQGLWGENGLLQKYDIFYLIDKYLITDNNPSSPSNWQTRYGTSTLRVGSKGEYVKNMQEDLNKLGYNVGNADGKFGKNTEKAVKAFQANNNLTADGLFGRKSKERLYEMVHSAMQNKNNIEEPASELSIEERLNDIEKKLGIIEEKLKNDNN